MVLEVDLAVNGGNNVVTSTPSYVGIQKERVIAPIERVPISTLKVTGYLRLESNTEKTLNMLQNMTRCPANLAILYQEIIQGTVNINDILRELTRDTKNSLTFPKVRIPQIKKVAQKTTESSK